MPNDSAPITDVLAVLSQRGTRTAMRWKRYGVWQTISGEAMAARAGSIANGLLAIGLKAGDVAGIIGDNCAEWVLADLAIIAAGAVSAGFDAQSDFDELTRVLNDTKARVLFVAGDVQLHKAITVRDRCPNLMTIVVMHQEWDDGTDAAAAMPITELEARGAAVTQSRAVHEPDAAAMIVYTSGMTGPARGAILSGRTIALQASRAAQALGLTEHDERLSLTAIHHVLERIVGIHASLLAGTIINFFESRETALANLAELQPTIVQASPQVWARLQSGINLAIADATPFQRWVCRKAFAGRNALTDPFVLKPIRARIGLSRARLCLSGGAPLRHAVANWFATLGRPLTDLYGHAETGGAVSIDGVAIDGHSIERSDNDTIMIRSATLFQGYAGHDAPTTAPTWPTGDIAADGSNAVRVVGRSSHLLGARPAHATPFAAEEALTASPYIADAFLHRDRDGRVIAHILMDQDNVVRYAQDRSIPFTHFLSLCRSDDIRALIGREVATAAGKTPDMPIDDFRLIERALGPHDREVSPALALRRRLLIETDDHRDKTETTRNDLENATP